jgi:hypothetical protein
MEQNTPLHLFIAVFTPAVTCGFDHVKQKVIFVATDGLGSINMIVNASDGTIVQI